MNHSQSVVEAHYQARAVSGVAAKAQYAMDDANRKAGLKQKLLKSKLRIFFGEKK